MASNRCLGIYIAPGRITAVAVDKSGSQWNSAGVVTVSDSDLSDERQGDITSLIELLADRVTGKFPNVSQVAITLDSSYYQSQSYISQFDDLRQIRQTIRFDIEEEFAIDAEGVTIAYLPVPTDKPGTRLMVYTGDTFRLLELFGSLETAGLDALAAEPEIESWRHWLDQNREKGNETSITLACLNDGMYMIVQDQTGNPVVMRSFPLPRQSDFVEMAAAEIRRSIMTMDDMPRLIYYHSTELDNSAMQDLAARLSMTARPVTSPPMNEVFALGVGIGMLDKQIAADFRQDNLPSRTAQRSQNRSMWSATAAVCTFLLVWIGVVFFHGRQYQSFAQMAGKDIDTAWRKSVPNQEIPKRNIDKILEGELTKLRRQFRGQEVEYISDSAGQTLMNMLLFLNQISDDIGLQIEKVSVNPEGVYAFSGSIKDLAAFDQLRETLRTCGIPLEVDRSSFEPPSGATRSFSMPLRLVTTTQVASSGKSPATK